MKPVTSLSKKFTDLVDWNIVFLHVANIIHFATLTELHSQHSVRWQLPEYFWHLQWMDMLDSHIITHNNETQVKQVWDNLQ